MGNAWEVYWWRAAGNVSLEGQVASPACNLQGLCSGLQRPPSVAGVWKRAVVRVEPPKPARRCTVASPGAHCRHCSPLRWPGGPRVKHWAGMLAEIIVRARQSKDAHPFNIILSAALSQAAQALTAETGVVQDLDQGSCADGRCECANASTNL